MLRLDTLDSYSILRPKADIPIGYNKVYWSSVLVTRYVEHFVGTIHNTTGRQVKVFLKVYRYKVGCLITRYPERLQYLNELNIPIAQ